MLSSHRFLCLPLHLPPCTVPCRTVRRLAAYRPSNSLVHPRDGSSQTTARAATLRQKLQHQTCCLTQSQYTDTGPTSPRAGLITPDALQEGHWILSHWFDWTRKKPHGKTRIEPGFLHVHFTTRPTRRPVGGKLLVSDQCLTSSHSARSADCQGGQ